MLKKITIILLLAMPFFAISQNFIPINGNNKLWSVDYKFNSIIHGNEWVNLLYKIEGDTVINNMTYYRLQGSIDSLRTWQVFNFIREDSAQNVFTWNEFEGEKLLYSFNAQNGTVFDRINYIITIKAVDAVFIGNSNRKRVTVEISDSTNGSALTYTEYWIEGIGSVLNPLRFSPAGGVNSYLMCYYENNTLVWQNPDYNNCFYNNGLTSNTSVAHNIQNITISPNPVTNKLSLEINNLANASLEIYTAIGQKLFAQKVLSKELIDFSEYCNGLYFLKVFSENKLIYSEKIVKQ